MCPVFSFTTSPSLHLHYNKPYRKTFGPAHNSALMTGVDLSLRHTVDSTVETIRMSQVEGNVTATCGSIVNIYS